MRLLTSITFEFSGYVDYYKTLVQINILHFQSTMTNKSSIQIAHNDMFQECVRHIKIDCYFVHHHLQQANMTCFILIRHASSFACYLDQLANEFTRSHEPYTPGSFRTLITNLSLKGAY